MKTAEFWTRGKNILNKMHNTALGAKFFSKEHELRLSGLVEASYRHSPWGVSKWVAPAKFRWQAVDTRPVTESVLARDSDHAAVLIVDRYMVPVMINNADMLFYNVKDPVPTLYHVRVADLGKDDIVSTIRTGQNSTYYPLINRKEILQNIANLPPVVVGHYRYNQEHFVWTWNTEKNTTSHVPLCWFNDAPREWHESIDVLRMDWSSGLLVGAGHGMPMFVLSSDGQQLLAFVREYRGGSVTNDSNRLIVDWTERISRQVGHAYAY